MIEARRMDGKPRQKVLYVLPTVHMCCLPGSAFRAAWWLDVRELMDEAEREDGVQWDRTSIIHQLEAVVPPPAPEDERRLEAYRQQRKEKEAAARERQRAEAEARRQAEQRQRDEAEARRRAEEQRRAEAEQEQQRQRDAARRQAEQRQRDEAEARRRAEEARRQRRSPLEEAERQFEEAAARWEAAKRRFEHLCDLRARDPDWYSDLAARQRYHDADDALQAADDAMEAAGRRLEEEQQKQQRSQRGPSPGPTTWWSVLDLPPTATKQQVKRRFLELAKIHHPDCWGDAEVFKKIYSAYEEGMRKAC